VEKNYFLACDIFLATWDEYSIHIVRKFLWLVLKYCHISIILHLFVTWHHFKRFIPPFFCLYIFFLMHPQVPWWIQLWVQRWREWKEKELGRVPWLTTLWGRVVCWSFGKGLGRATNGSIIHMDLHKPNNKLVSA
jgi:hypothetical protein